MNCDFAYVAPTGLVTSQALDGSTLTLTGTDLPTADLQIDFAETTCDVSTITSDGSTVTCTLAEIPAAGSWIANLVDTYGAIPNDAALVAIDTIVTVSALNPNFDINENGGGVVTLTGEGFSKILANNVITLDDGTACTPQTASTTELTCIMSAFTADTINYDADAYTMTVDVYGSLDGT